MASKCKPFIERAIKGIYRYRNKKALVVSRVVYHFVGDLSLLGTQQPPPPFNPTAKC